VSSEQIGFVGLGNMGGRIVRHIVESGAHVSGFDTRPEVVAACGVSPAASVADAAVDCAIVFLSLPNSAAVEAVVLGTGGLVEASRSGQVIVDLGTSAPESTRKLAAAFAERGATFLDAGISGGAAAADAGTLTLMVGGEEAALEQIRPTLDLFASKIYHCGSSGAGHIAKLLNNFLNAVALSATAEVMVAGKKAGLDLEVLLGILNSSSGVNFATQNRFPKIIHGDYLEGGLTGELMLKDVTLYVDLLGSLGVASLNSSGPVASFGLANGLGYGTQISNRVVDAIGDVSGGVRLHDPDSTAR
jgi:3-hydroxyisobutyrate dehydrogenase-like beta-hydroxyacid dehydrogenase